MRVLLDNAPCECPVDSVAQAIAAGAAIAESTGRMIVEVVVDGEYWTAERLQDLDHHDNAGEVRLTSADPNELVRQTLDDALNALTDVDRLQQSAAHMIQAGQVQPAMGELNDAFMIWSSIQQAVSMSADLVQVELEELPVGMSGTANGHLLYSPNETIEQLNSELRKVREALSVNDMAALADSLLYDLPPVIEQWRGLLTQMKSAIR